MLPVPLEHGQDPRKAALGRRLFADPRLSADGSTACSRCHLPALGGVDRLARSIGVGGASGIINAPTVFNARFNLAQFWDGRAASLEDQIDGPIHNPIEQATNWPDVIRRLSQDADYRQAFSELYRDGIDAAAIRDAIATYERTLITTNAPFDRWLRGDDSAIAEIELEGYQLFKFYGCIACHQGVNVGGNMYQRMGTLGDYFGDRGDELTQADLGRLRVTGDERDRFSFKVPSLRLAVLTPPYFHDGSVDTLKEAIEVMAKYQLGRPIPPHQVEAIEAFMGSLVGEHPELDP